MSWRRSLLGAEHPLFAAVTSTAAADRRAGLAIATGGDPSRIRWETKGDPSIPNEDAVCVVDGGARVLVAVADAHFGHRASHAAIDLLARLRAVPADPAALARAVAAIAALPVRAGDASATALAVAVLERARGTGFGLSFGDATVATVDARSFDRWSVPDHDFVALGRGGGFAGPGRAFDLTVPEGGLLVAFTDGVDGCGGPGGDSIAAADLCRLCAQTRSSAPDFARALAELALRGVRGRPGGHDNVAVAAVAR